MNLLKIQLKLLKKARISISANWTTPSVIFFQVNDNADNRNNQGKHNWYNDEVELILRFLNKVQQVGA